MRLSLRIGFMGLALASELLCNIAESESLRVTSWNLGVSPQTQDTSRIIEQAADTLRTIDPDVVLLQGIRDWEMCAELAESIAPSRYRVVVCSAFRAVVPGAPDESQVAILSKRKAFFTWSEPWQSTKSQARARGMAFAAIDAGKQKVGFFSVQAARQQASDELSRKVLAQIDSLGHWETNQIQTFVIAASFDPQWSHSNKALYRTARAFDGAGFVGATEELAPELKTTLRAAPVENQGGGDILFAGLGGVPTDARITETPFADHYPTTCELELDPEKVSLALDLRGEKRREQQALAARNMEYLAGGILGSCVAITAMVGFFAKRRSRVAVQQRAEQPIRLKPKMPAGPVRPIIIVERPAAPLVVKAPESAKLRAPALRLQRPPPRVPAVPPPLPVDSVPPPQQHPAEKKTLPAESPLRALEEVQDRDVRQGVIRELSGWLKQKLVRKLVTDRSQLMAAQQLAARMANTLDNRLARIEVQIQQQNQAYVRRIEELNKELAAAREENRELIRERIAQVKAEMEAARARVLAEAHLDNKSIRL